MRKSPAPFAVFRADRAEYVGRFPALVFRRRRPGSASRPAPRDLVLLTDTGLI